MHKTLIVDLSFSSFKTFACQYLASATKHGIIGLMDSLRMELHRERMDGINFTGICPALVATGFVSNPRVKGPFQVLTAEHVVATSFHAILRNEVLVTVPSIAAPIALRFVGFKLYSCIHKHRN